MFFRKKKRSPESLWEILEEEGIPGLDAVMYREVPKTEEKDTDLLDTAILGFFSKEYESIGEIDRYFKNHRREDVNHHFEGWVYANDWGNPMNFRGLCLLLLQKAKYPETIKFAIELGRWFSLGETKRAMEMIAAFGAHPEFTEDALSVLGEIPQGTPYIFTMYENTPEEGKERINAYVKGRIRKEKK